MDIATGVQKARRFVAGLSVVTLLASLFVANVAQAATYSDVPADAWFYTYVEQLAAAGILDTTQQNYRPADLANRAEAAKLLVEAAGLTIDTSAGPSFTDVAPGAWYYQYVETAAKNGVVGGYKDAAGNLTGKFGPGDPVTREQFAKMAVNAMTLTSTTTGGPHFPDVGTDRWSYAFVETLYNWSVVDGYPDGSFKPGNNINRAEIAKMVVGAMNPVVRGSSGAFNVQTASATSATMVSVMFSQDVDMTSGAVAGNYSIMDANNTALAVTAATVSADTVTLTTASQTSNKPYVLTVTGVTAAGGKALDTDTANFNGYNPLGVGGPLTVSLDPNTPAPKSVPKGASGVVFTCWDFTAGSSAVVVQSLTAHRIGAGDEQDFANVYLYNGAQRLTTGRTVNSETQMVEFNNVNVNVAAGGMAQLCAVGDFATTALGASQHAFELLAAGITTNASSVSGTFPLTGSLMTVAGGTAGTATITRNGSLDEVTVGQVGARIAQFQVELDGSEDADLTRVALYIRGSIRPTDLSNLKLYTEGGAEVLATADAVASNSLVTLVLTKPYTIGRGQRKIFYVTSDVKGRNGDDIKTYLDETTDILLTGKTFGFGLQVDDSTLGTYDGADPDGTPGTADDQFSRVTLKGSTFTVAFNGPSAGNVAVGQKAAHCMDMTITNASGGAVELKNWVTTLTIQNPSGVANDVAGLVNGAATASAADDQPNFTLIKLARLNADGTVGGSLLGPSELTAAGNDATQDLTLGGSATINAGESVKAAIVFDVFTGAANNDQIRCTLKNLTTTSDAVRDSNGDALTASSITPSTDINGNIMTITSAGLTFELGSTPSSRTLTSGTNNADLVGFTVRSGSALDNTIKNLSVQGYVDSNTAGLFSATGTADFATFGDTSNSALKDIVDSVALFDGNTQVSDLKNVGTDGKVVFNNLTIPVLRSTTKTLTIRGHINNSAPYGTLNDRVKFGVVAPTDVTAIDSNQQTVPTASIVVTAAANSGTADAGTIMVISSGGTGTTANLAAPSAMVVTGDPAAQLLLSSWRFTSVNETAKLKDLQIGVENSSSAVVDRVFLYSGAGCSTAVGDPGGYAPSGTTGIVTVADINTSGVDIPDASSLTLCGKAIVKPVGPLPATQPVSGSTVGLVLLNVTEVSGGSGSNITERYVADNTLGHTIDAAVAVVDTSINTTDAGGGDFFTGDVLVVDQEMMLVTVDNGDSTYNVLRGFGNTTVAAHQSGAAIGKSTIAVSDGDPTAGTMDLNEAVDGVETGIDVVSGAAFHVGDVVSWTNTALTGVEYALVTGITANTLTVQRGLFGSTAQVNDGADTNDEVTAFTLHGALDVLRRSKPTITLNALPSGAGALPGNGRTTILSMHVVASGQDSVDFIGANANQIEVQINDPLALATGDCFLTDGVNDYAQVINYGAGLNDFAFNLKDLNMTPGSSIDLLVQCDTTAFSVVGANISAQLLKADATVEWGDGAVANITTDGQRIITSTLSGPSFTYTGN